MALQGTHGPLPAPAWNLPREPAASLALHSLDSNLSSLETSLGWESREQTSLGHPSFWDHQAGGGEPGLDPEQLTGLSPGPAAFGVPGETTPLGTSSASVPGFHTGGGTSETAEALGCDAPHHSPPRPGFAHQAIHKDGSGAHRLCPWRHRGQAPWNRTDGQPPLISCQVCLLYKCFSAKARVFPAPACPATPTQEALRQRD